MALKNMDCKSFESELMDLVLTPESTPSVAAVAHMKSCPPCAEEYVSFQQTFGVLDTWTAPEPTPYFDQKLAVLLREEQAAPRMGWFESLMTRLRFNTGRNFRPAMVGALSLALMVLVGFGLMQCASASNTIIQSLVADDKRARAMSYYTMAFFGGAPFGSLLAGALAHRIGAPHTVMVTGAFCIAGSLWFTLELPKVRVLMRPVYQEMGLLPDLEAR